MSDEKPQQAQDYASLAQEHENLRIKYDKLEKQYRQAIDIATRYNERLKAEEEAKKADLVEKIFFDAKGQFTKEQLTPKTLEELTAIRTGMDAAMDKTFAGVASEIDETQKRKKPQLTVGSWDTEKKKWVGGI